MIEGKKGNPWALLPFFVFVAVYIISGIVTNDFYALPVTVPFLLAALVALAMNKRESFNAKLERFCLGAADTNIILMCIIFILAGAFAQVAKDMGAVDSTVNLGLSLLPGNILIAGVFVIACFISTSIGTSMGTIAAIAPMAVGIAAKTGVPVELALAAVVGGSMFGDNLSMISDTTIAATKTQGCELKDKFRVNFKIVLPAAILTTIILAVITSGNEISLTGAYSYSLVKVLPYIFVLAGALLGGNVILILIFGTVFSGVVGIATGAFNIVGFAQSVGKGITGMSDLVIMSLLISGIVELVKYNGGIDFIIDFIIKRIKSKKGAEIGISVLISIVDACTANNTIAIVMVGPLAKDIADRFGVDPRKTASLLDTFSCFVQGIIPYGAQILVAAGVAKISPILVMKYLYYPYLMGICAIIAILTGLPKLTPIKEKINLDNEQVA
ncbi:Na+/H+ antiporter NhaC family protein [Clostridium sp. A1-XYC3]|uniref:Na+/H+ antiporter NhaC family protein n=1 Tax=Clostridium tanneri TaxID=3037988 RepID=A0ABU4JV15_9CLOT|nr:Na+/H+ antiporter NhaC family protein [Clostridium sp. A1-XYC3]MDW8801995.1 Na+/H+ antiporter NhaC family protein [Clostridium sp. A1-XYC3]